MSAKSSVPSKSAGRREPAPAPLASDAAIRQALTEHAQAQQRLSRLERSAPRERTWKSSSGHESELARARREVALGALALRSARLRALNERIERLRHPPPPAPSEPEHLSLFDVLGPPRR